MELLVCVFYASEKMPNDVSGPSTYLRLQDWICRDSAEVGFSR